MQEHMVKLASYTTNAIVVGRCALARPGVLERDSVRVVIGAVNPLPDAAWRYVDANLSGRIDSTPQRHSAPVKPPASGPAGTEARYDVVDVGGTKCGVRVVRRLASSTATLFAPGSAPGSLTFSETKPATLSKAPALSGPVRYASAQAGDR